MISKVMPEMILEKIFEIIPKITTSSACPRQKMALFYEDKKEKEEK